MAKSKRSGKAERSLELKILLSRRTRPSEAVRKRGAEALGDPEVIAVLQDLSRAARADVDPTEEFGTDKVWVRSGGEADRAFVEAAVEEIEATMRALTDRRAAALTDGRAAKNRRAAKSPKASKDTHRIGWYIDKLIAAEGESRKVAESRAGREFTVSTGAARGAYTRYRQRKIKPPD